MKAGYVYLLGNQAMPGVYKIGRTTNDPFKRAEQLSSGTSTPCPFHVICFIEVADCARDEHLIHQGLADFRLSFRREFFAFHRDAQSWLLAVFKHFPRTEKYFQPSRFSLRDVVALSECPWAFDPDLNEFFLNEMCSEPPIDLYEAALVG